MDSKGERVDFQVIDTPGLQDTNRQKDDVEQELFKLQKLAPHGISAVLVCSHGKSDGRTRSHLAQSRATVWRTYGAAFRRRRRNIGSCQARTRTATCPPKQKRLDGTNGQVARGSLFTKMGRRSLVAIGGCREHARTKSSLCLHQAVLDTVAANGGKKFQFSAVPDNNDNPSKQLKQMIQEESKQTNSSIEIPSSESFLQRILSK